MGLDSSPDCNGGGRSWTGEVKSATSISWTEIRMDVDVQSDCHFLSSLNPKVQGSSPWAGTTSRLSEAVFHKILWLASLILLQPPF
jgi:hypothetical protein